MFDGVSNARFPWWSLGIAAAAASLGLTLAGGWWWTRRLPSAPPAPIAAWAPPNTGEPYSALHSELFPAWSSAKSPREAESNAIIAALAEDPALQHVVQTLLLGTPDQAEDAADVWNAAMQARDQPWAVKVGARRRRYLKTLYVLGRPTAATGDQRAQVTIAKRVDRLNVVEGWLGRAEDIGGAMVVSDRVQAFAIDTLWPLLAEEGAAAEALRAELGRRLPAESLQALVATAAQRRAMLSVDKAVQHRRDCGSSFRMRLPWDGMNDYARLLAYAERFAGQDCPGLTHAEARTLILGTQALRERSGLPEALSRLVAQAARHVVVHEARHRVDQEAWGFGEPPRCHDCGLGGKVRIEASAYLSALASDEGLVALLQICALLEAGGGGSGEQAATALLAVLEVSCEAPPADLSQRAAALSARWFDRDERWLLTGMPEAAPLAGY